MINPEDLYKLSEKHFNISIEERNRYYLEIKDIIDANKENLTSDAVTAQEILKLIVDIFESKKIEMVSGSLSADAPKKKGSFSRAGAERGSVFSKEDDCIKMNSGIGTNSKIIILK